MPDVSDMELVRNCSQQGSEEAFAGLVGRHINLVYSTALRHVGIAAFAEESRQVVAQCLECGRFTTVFS